MREIVHLQVGQCGNQIGSKVRKLYGFSWELLSQENISIIFGFHMIFLINYFSTYGYELVSLKIDMENSRIEKWSHSHT
jgi:hypothetical protein